jgi:hypothetical protein
MGLQVQGYFSCLFTVKIAYKSWKISPPFAGPRAAATNQKIDKKSRV